MYHSTKQTVDTVDLVMYKHAALTKVAVDLYSSGSTFVNIYNCSFVVVYLQVTVTYHRTRFYLRMYAAIYIMYMVS